MLIQLDIENIAVIEKASIEFEKGLNVITGETGSGKSLLINSLGMILGLRQTHEIIRDGAPYARVGATFFVPELSEIFTDLGIDFEDGDLTISRKLFPDGRNVCHINGNAVNVSILREVGKHLVVLHGQRDSAMLLDSQSHIRFLDNFMDRDDLIRDYSNCFEKYNNARKLLDKMQTNLTERQNEIDYLTFQVEQIEKANLEIGEEEILRNRKKILESAQTLQENCDAAYSHLSRSSGARELLHAAMNHLETLCNYDDSATDLKERATNLYYEADELCHDIAAYSSKIETDDSSLREVCDRLDEINSLKRRFNKDIDDIITYAQESRARINELLSYDENRASLEKEVSALEKEAQEKAIKLSSLRREAANKLCGRLCLELEELDMKKCSVVFDFKPTPLSKNGIDDVEILLSTNPSESVKPLSKIASGGEMNRIMLAIKSVFCDFDSIPTLLFDEIDTGVSGRAAEKIAKKMHTLSKNYQLICVTHLPLIASSGNHHILIEKLTDSDNFKTIIRSLDYDERIGEISRIISGDKIDSVSIENARRMLDYYKGD